MRDMITDEIHHDEVNARSSAAIQDAQVRLRRMQGRLRRNGELSATLLLRALAEPGTRRFSPKLRRAQAAAVRAKAAIAPDHALKEDPGMMRRRHLLPDVSDGLQFGDHGRASLRGNPEDWPDRGKPKWLRDDCSGAYVRQAALVYTCDVASFGGQ